VAELVRMMLRTQPAAGKAQPSRPPADPTH